EDVCNLFPRTIPSRKPGREIRTRDVAPVPGRAGSTRSPTRPTEIRGSFRFSSSPPPGLPAHVPPARGSAFLRMPHKQPPPGRQVLLRQSQGHTIRETPTWPAPGFRRVAAGPDFAAPFHFREAEPAIHGAPRPTLPEAAVHRGLVRRRAIDTE